MYDADMTELAAETYRLTGDMPEHVREFGSAVVTMVLSPPAKFSLVSNELDPNFQSVAFGEVSLDYPNVPEVQLKFWRSGPAVASARLPGENSEDGHPTAEEIHLFQNGDLTCFTYQYPNPLSVKLAAARLHVDKSDAAEASGLNSRLVAIMRYKPKTYLKGTKPLLVESVVGVPEDRLRKFTAKLVGLAQS